MATSTPQQASYKPLLTKKETAEFYAVTERTIDRWLQDGTLPAEAKLVIGGSVRFRQHVLQRHINEQGSAGDVDRA